MIFSLRPEGIGEYTPEERHNVPWPSCTLGRIGCPSGAGAPNTAGGYRLGRDLSPVSKSPGSLTCVIDRHTSRSAVLDNCGSVAKPVGSHPHRLPAWP